MPPTEPLTLEVLIYPDRTAIRVEGDASHVDIESKPRRFDGPFADLKALASRLSTEERRFFVRLRETSDGRSRVGVQVRSLGRTRASTFDTAEEAQRYIESSARRQQSAPACGLRKMSSEDEDADL